MIFVIGAEGMLGSAILNVADKRVRGLGRNDLDITDANAIGGFFERHAPRTVINCAAWTDVDSAETDLDVAMRVNALGPAMLATAADAYGASIVHMSSDYVFDGKKHTPYTEEDAPKPINRYGQSKLAGEQAVLSASREATVIRTAWLYGPNGENFVSKMLSQANEPLEIVNDQVGSPTYTGHLAPAVLKLARCKSFGVHHLAADGECSWFEFANAILPNADISPVTSQSFNSAARRPRYSALSSTRNRSLPHWKRGLEEYLDH